MLVLVHVYVAPLVCVVVIVHVSSVHEVHGFGCEHEGVSVGRAEQRCFP